MCVSQLEIKLKHEKEHERFIKNQASTACNQRDSVFYRFLHKLQWVAL